MVLVSFGVDIMVFMPESGMNTISRISAFET